MSKLIFLVTEDWWFCQHFLPLARAAKAAGLDVVVASRLRRHRERIEAERCRAIPLEGNADSVPGARPVRLARLPQNELKYRDGPGALNDVAA